MMKKYSISSFELKIIAIVLMLIDHTGVIIGYHYGRDVYWIMRYIGRSAFPIFVFMLVEGFSYTRNRWLYLRNLILFALISELPFDLMNFGWENRREGMNIFWTLSIGLFGLIIIEMIAKWLQKQKLSSILTNSLCVLIYLIIPIALMCLGTFLGVDYGSYGVLFIFMVYYVEKLIGYFVPNNEQIVKNASAAIAIFLWLVYYDVTYSGRILELYGIVSIIPVLLYNGEHGNYRLPKYFFYFFYPLHISLLVLVRELIIQSPFL